MISTIFWQKHTVWTAKDLKQFGARTLLSGANLDVKKPSVLIREECLLFAETEGRTLTDSHQIVRVGIKTVQTLLRRRLHRTPKHNTSWQNVTVVRSKTHFNRRLTLYVQLPAHRFHSSSNRIWRGRVWTPGSKNNHLASTGSWERALGQE